MTSSNWFRLAVLPLVLHVAIQPVLAADVAARLVVQWSIQDQANALLLLFFELSRGARCLIGLALVALLLGRKVITPHARALALFLLFGEMAYAMAFASTGFAGPLQERLSAFFIASGLSRPQLQIAFGYPDWALWLALAALIRFAVLFPEPLTLDAIEASGQNDRRGLLRQVPGAGADIGDWLRALTRRALRSGWLGGFAVWSMAVTGALLSVLLRGQMFKLVLWPPFALGLALAITSMRASYSSGEQDARIRLRWIARGALAGCAFFALAGIAGMAAGRAAALSAFVLLTIAPGAVLFGLGMAVLQRRSRENVVLVGT
jgi:hypothetical protein